MAQSDALSGNAGWGDKHGHLHKEWLLQWLDGKRLGISTQAHYVLSVWGREAVEINAHRRGNLSK